MPRTPTKTQGVEIQADADLKKFRVAVSDDVDDFVRRMVYRHRVSKSAVVETALLMLMRHADDEVGVILRSAGAGLRRR